MEDNKAKRHFIGGLEVMIDALTMGTGNAILAQEARGQQELVSREMLPVDMGKREDYEALGFVFGNRVDDLFISATLPAGWKKQATDHSMHSDIVDDKGRHRAHIFYKAAFYDRSANMGLTRRFSYSVQPICGYGGNFDREEKRTIGVITDCGTIIWQTEAVEIGSGEWKKHDELGIAAKAKLNELYPDWQNPLAYWD